MQVLFFSECISFFRILQSSFTRQFPDLQLVYYPRLQDYDRNSNHIKFSHLIIKLTDPEPQLKLLGRLKKQDPEIKAIALSTDGFELTKKNNHPYVDFLFNDQEIELKLHSYFYKLLANRTLIDSPEDLAIDSHCQKYLNLKSNLSTCLYLISQGLSAMEIASKMCKSERSIEEYTLQLKKTFDVSSKRQLKAIYSTICKTQGKTLSTA